MGTYSREPRAKKRERERLIVDIPPRHEPDLHGVDSDPRDSSSRERANEFLFAKKKINNKKPPTNRSTVDARQDSPRKPQFHGMQCARDMIIARILFGVLSNFPSDIIGSGAVSSLEGSWKLLGSCILPMWFLVQARARPGGDDFRVLGFVELF